MLCFFMLLMTVSSAPLALVPEKITTDAQNYVALFQNKTLLSELAEADPTTLRSILDLLEGLLGVSQAASLKYTTDVSDALAAKSAASATLAEAVNNQTDANEDRRDANTALIAAGVAVGTADDAVVDYTGIYNAADAHHQEMVEQLNTKQPGVDAESETLAETITLVESLLPVVVDRCVPCSCSGWDGQLYSNCRLVTSSNKCTGYCAKCQEDGTTPMAGNAYGHGAKCEEYSRGL